MPRNNPPKPFTFYDTALKGKSYRTLLQVPEGFLRIDSLSKGDVFPEVPTLLMNAGLFPEVNTVSLLKQSNTFVVRLNRTFAYSQESAEETVAEIEARLSEMLDTGEARYVTNELQDLVDDMNYQYGQELDTYPRLPQHPDYDEPLEDDVQMVQAEDDDIEPFDDVDLSDDADSFLSELLAGFGEDDDDDDDFNSGGNILVPVPVR